MNYTNEYELLRAVQARKAAEAKKAIVEAPKAEEIVKEEPVKEEVKFEAQEEVKEEKKTAKKVKRTTNKEFLVEEKEQPKIEVDAE